MGISNPASQGYIYIRDEQASGVAGGASLAATWNTRALNTKVVDTNSSAALASNQITLQPGTYRFMGRGVASNITYGKMRLQNISDGITVAYGESGYISGQPPTTFSVRGRFTIASAKIFELQHYTTLVGEFGLAASIAGVAEVYAEIEFFKEG